MKNCIICKNEAKYKCPTCRIDYCSVNCFKRHKANQCTAPIVTPLDVATSNGTEEQFITEDTVSTEKLKLLGHDKEVKQLLENVHLQEFLKEIDKTTCPENVIQKAMMEPIFVEFVNACLKIVEDKNTV